VEITRGFGGGRKKFEDLAKKRQIAECGGQRGYTQSGQRRARQGGLAFGITIRETQQKIIKNGGLWLKKTGARVQRINEGTCEKKEEILE